MAKITPAAKATPAASGDGEYLGLETLEFEASSGFNKFWGTATNPVLVPWKTPNAPNYSLALRITVVPQDDSMKPFDNYLKAGKLDFFLPTNDGMNPAGGTVEWYQGLIDGTNTVSNESDCEGFLPMKNPSQPRPMRTKMQPGTNLHFFLTMLQDLGVVLSPDFRFIGGLYGYWSQTPVPGRNLKLEAGQLAPKDPLVIVELGTAPAASVTGPARAANVAVKPVAQAAQTAKAAPASAPAGAPKAAPASAGGATAVDAEAVEDRLEEQMSGWLAAAPNQAMTRAEFGPLIQKHFTLVPERRIALGAINNSEFLNGRTSWVYDVATTTLTLSESAE